MKPILFTLVLLLAASVPAGAASRVVSLSPALTETVIALAGIECLAGRSESCDYPPEVKKIPAAGRFGFLEVEKILALKPDWVIANDLVQPSAAKALRRAGVKTSVRQCRSICDYIGWFERIGEELNCREKAAQEIARVREFEANMRTLPPLRGKVLWVIFDSPLMVAGPGSLPDEVLRMAGAQNAAAGVGSEYFKCSEEWVIRLQPEVIVFSLPGAPDPNHRFWGALTAVRENRVITGLDDSLVLRPGPRWSEGILALRKALEEKLP